MYFPVPPCRLADMPLSFSQEMVSWAPPRPAAKTVFPTPDLPYSSMLMLGISSSSATAVGALRRADAGIGRPLGVWLICLRSVASVRGKGKQLVQRRVVDRPWWGSCQPDQLDQHKDAHEHSEDVVQH